MHFLLRFKKKYYVKSGERACQTLQTPPGQLTAKQVSQQKVESIFNKLTKLPPVASTILWHASRHWGVGIPGYALRIYHPGLLGALLPWII